MQCEHENATNEKPAIGRRRRASGHASQQGQWHDEPLRRFLNLGLAKVISMKKCKPRQAEPSRAKPRPKPRLVPVPQNRETVSCMYMSKSVECMYMWLASNPGLNFKVSRVSKIFDCVVAAQLGPHSSRRATQARSPILELLSPI